MSNDKEVIIGMDHNLDLLKSSTHKHTQQFIDEMTDKNLLPMITRPTCKRVILRLEGCYGRVSPLGVITVLKYVITTF